MVLVPVPASATSDDLVLPSESMDGLPEFCSHIAYLALITQSLAIGLSSSGRLYAGSTLLTSDATSFVLSPDFVIYTTFSHEARFVPLFSLERGAQARVEHTEGLKHDKEEAGESGKGTKRAVERGSRIVTVVPSSTTLVLQMPRGNLETICPRPLVLRVVRQDLDR